MTGIENIISPAKQDTSAAHRADVSQKPRTVTDETEKKVEDFISILLQQAPDADQNTNINTDDLEAQLRQLAAQSPEEFSAALQKTEQNGQTSLQAILKSLPPSLLQQHTALAAQLTAQANNAAQNSSSASTPITQTHEALTSPADASAITQNTLSLNAKGSQTSPSLSGDTTQAGQKAGVSHQLSFDAGNKLQSFVSDGGRKPLRNTAEISDGNTTSPKPQKSAMPQLQSTPQTAPQPTPTQNAASNTMAAAPSASLFAAQAGTAEYTLDGTLLQGNGQFTADGHLQAESLLAQTKSGHAPQSLTAFMSGKAAGALPTPTNQKIMMTMQRNAAARIQQMTLQLDPAEMGRVEINMKFGKDGAVKAHLLVEKTETYQMLQRDAHTLESALRDAGLELDDSALSFDLASRDDQFADDNENNTSDDSFALDMANLKHSDPALDPLLAAQEIANQNGYISRDHVNILI